MSELRTIFDNSKSPRSFWGRGSEDKQKSEYLGGIMKELKNGNYEDFLTMYYNQHIAPEYASETDYYGKTTKEAKPLSDSDRDFMQLFDHYKGANKEKELDTQYSEQLKKQQPKQPAKKEISDIDYISGLLSGKINPKDYKQI